MGADHMLDLFNDGFYFLLKAYLRITSSDCLEV